MKKKKKIETRGRKAIPDHKKKGKLTLSIDREIIKAAKRLPGSLSAQVERFLVDLIARSK